LGYALPLLEPSSGWWIASFIEGIVAGYFAKSGAGKGALAGFVAVIISAIIMMILAIAGLPEFSGGHSPYLLQSLELS
jgi:hypothetical protein